MHSTFRNQARARLVAREPKFRQQTSTMFRYVLSVSVLLVLVHQVSFGQNGNEMGPFAENPSPYNILGVSVEGAETEFTRSFVHQASNLVAGESITIPGDPALADAIRSIYRLGMFSSVKIVEERRVNDGVYLAIHVKEEPKLAEYSFEGIKYLLDCIGAMEGNLILQDVKYLDRRTRIYLRLWLSARRPFSRGLSCGLPASCPARRRRQLDRSAKQPRRSKRGPLSGHRQSRRATSSSPWLEGCW